MKTKRGSVTLSEFKHTSAAAIRRMKKNGEPMVLTVNGEAEVVVQDFASYSRLVEALDRAEAIAGIRRGLEAVAQGETVPVEEAFENIRRKHGLQR